MALNLTKHDADELTIQQVSRRTGLAESALRYYERIGLIEEVPVTNGVAIAAIRQTSSRPSRG
jgi:hypothetical protein